MKWRWRQDGREERVFQPLLFFLLGNDLKGVQIASHSTDSIAKKCSTIEWVAFLFHRLGPHTTGDGQLLETGP